MKKIYCFIGLLSFVLAVLVGGCGLEAAKQDNGARQAASRAESVSPERSETQIVPRIRLTFGGREAIAKLYDNPASRDFASMLPLTLRFKDYNGAEKVADLPRALSLERAPKGFDPSAGDLTLFAPWGNLAVFYRDFRYSEGLVSLDRFTSGLDALAEMNGEFTVYIDVVQE